MRVSVVVLRSPVDGRLFLAYSLDSGVLPQPLDKLQLLDDGGSDLVSVTSKDDILHLFSLVLLPQCGCICC